MKVLSTLPSGGGPGAAGAGTSRRRPHPARGDSTSAKIQGAERIIASPPFGTPYQSGGKGGKSTASPAGPAVSPSGPAAVAESLHRSDEPAPDAGFQRGMPGIRNDRQPRLAP